MNLPPLPQPDTTRRLLTELAGWLRARVRVSVKTLFDTLDDSLFELAEHTTASTRQQQYFDGMRECRRRRDAIERDFLERLGHGTPSPDADEPISDTLALVGHEELEEDLAIASMASKAQQRLAAPLHALNQRIAFLLRQPSINDDDNPFGPAKIAYAFKSALAGLDVSLEVRLIVLKLFERHVLGSLEPIYGDMNIRLADAGIMPTLSSRVRREASAPQPGIDRPHDADQPASPPGAPPSGHIPAEQELLGSLIRMLGERLANVTPAHPAGPATPSPVRIGPDASNGGLQHAVSRVARRLAEGSPLPPPRQLAAQLLAEARYGSDGAAPTQAASVDLVGRIFDALMHDRQVPRPLYPLMQRLQVPLTRAAIEDPQALTESGHPARQLMDLVSEAMLGWCRSADPDGRLLAQIQDTIDGFTRHEDLPAQSKLLEELKTSLDTQRRRAELAEQRTVEATAGRERLWHARRKVHQSIAARLGQVPAPAWIRHLLTRPWANCLVLLWLRQGEDSAIYRESMGFADALLWCSTAGGSDVERLRLRALLPVLEAQLRQGLATVAYHESEVEQLIGELRGFMRWRLGETPAPAFLEEEPPVSRSPGVVEADPDIGEDQPLPAQVDANLLEQIRTVPPGTWFEFGNATGDRIERAKLSWISPYSGRCLFVNRNGMRVVDRRPEELVREIEKGLARVVEGTNLLQRALQSVLEQLRTDGGEQPKSA